MEPGQHQLLKSYMENMTVRLLTAEYTRVDENWRYYDIEPEVDRFYFIIDGEGWIKLRGQEHYPLPGQLVWLPAGVRQSFSRVNAPTYLKYWCHFTAKVGDVHLSRLVQTPPVVDVRLEDRERLAGYFRQLIELFPSEAVTAPLRIQALLYEIMALFLDSLPSGEVRLTSTAEASKIQFVLDYIDTHLHESITVEKLAGLVHFHPNYFLTYFKMSLGDTPISYINRKRMEKAQRELRETDRSVAEIADQLGLEAPYFSRMFRKSTGLSPRDFRRYLNTIGRLGDSIKF